MTKLLFLLLFSSSFVNADGWVVPTTGIVDYSQGQAQLPVFDSAPPSTTNYPLPEWSTDNQVPTYQPIMNIQEYGQ